MLPASAPGFLVLKVSGMGLDRSPTVRDRIPRPRGTRTQHAMARETVHGGAGGEGSGQAPVSALPTASLGPTTSVGQLCLTASLCAPSTNTPPAVTLCGHCREYSAEVTASPHNAARGKQYGEEKLRQREMK